MRNTTGMVIASFAAAGALLLTACGGDGDSSDGSRAKSPSSTAGSSASRQAGGADGGTDRGSMDLTFTSGTAAQNHSPKGTGDWATPPGKPAAKPVQRKWVQLSAVRAGDLNPVVVNGAGFTLYRFDKDTANPSKSNCSGACATTWPPVLVNPGGKIFVDGVEPSAVGVIARDDGTRQVTINGWPVYRFSKDTKPGDTNGQGVGGTWFGVTPDGQKAGAGQPAEQPDQAQQPQAPEPEAHKAAPATSAVLFDEPNFSDNGPAQGVAGVGCQTVARRNVASSIAASGSLKIWSKPNCKGDSKVINGNVADLSTIGFDNRVNSVFFG